MSAFPFFDHLTLGESDTLERLRATWPDHVIISQAKVVKPLRDRVTSEIIGYLRRNPRRQSEAA